MSYFIVYVVALMLLTGTAATNHTFTSSGEMNIASCPITYYGQTYDKVYVAFNANKFTVCFKGLYQPGKENDCIVMSGGTADRGDLSVLTKDIPTGSGVHKLLPNLKYAGKCVNIIPLKDSQQSQIEQLELGNFGSQAILAIKTYPGYTNAAVVADSQVNGLTVSKQSFQTNETNNGVITDVSGCRLSGTAYKTNTTVRDPNICSTVTCDVSGVASAISDCGPMEHCQGNGSCVLNTMCTVTGSTVIDFIGRVHSVPDRCGYTLMRSTLGVPGVKLVGIFQERRRKDVSFLDRVILQMDQAGVQISLGQGGRVQLNDKVLMVNTTAQVVHGVMLSRDQTGVTAKISASNNMVSVHFDGYTAQIHITGPSGAPVQGLCGNSSWSFSGERVSEHSAIDCETQYDDDANSTINCNTTTEWCNIMKQASFIACNKHINPEPFITACTRTLCKYPAVDGLKCQFLEAYARACSHHSNVTVDSWRSSTSCSAVSQAFCSDRFCSAHEFCGDSINHGEPRCLCRAIFASEYRSSNTFGEPTVCGQNSASITMANCLLEEQNIDYSILHLNDQACTGKMDHLTHMVTFNFDSSNSCGAVAMVNGSQIIYKNSIMTRNSSMSGLINRHDRVHIDFSCHYRQPETKNLAIRIKDSSVTQQIISGEWYYNLSMNAYTNPERNKAIQPDTYIELNKKIWVELKTEGLNEEMIHLLTDSCWATDQPLPDGSLRYDLVIKGCPNPTDKTVNVVGNGLGTSNFFSFNLFQFTGKTTTDIYFHCKVELCVRDGNTCAPRCSQANRSRRSVTSKYENPAFITLAWTY
ncbi:alpha-tectorin [Larimichthys crocea]|uniref:alpha-tectorin n=1 Tax=Larimichthys crocea TaxID=215358 RepID=UPI00054B5567|nr:alpha-tectorin [Larimichthys crocea]